MEIPTTEPVLLEEKKELSFLPEFLQYMHEYMAVISGRSLSDPCLQGTRRPLVDPCLQGTRRPLVDPELCEIDIFVFDTTKFNELYSKMNQSDHFGSIAMTTADDTLENIVKMIYGSAVDGAMYNIFLVSPEFELPKPKAMRDGARLAGGGIYLNGKIYSQEMALVYLANTELTYFDTEKGPVVGVNAPNGRCLSNKFNLYRL